jgi:DNA-directed RNA polymerase subunit RPC12/RpoP
MSEVVRDPNGVFACPRCGRPVLYKGRGRRPVWCSTQCRVEASIERRGNRMVGVEPHVVTVIPPKQRVSEWEENERRRLRATLTEDAVSVMVAENPLLLVKVLERTKRSAESGSDAQREVVAQRLRETADAIAPDTALPAGPAGVRVHHQSWKRSAAEWATLLNELATQLANGQFYSRDLPLIDEPLHLLAERYVRRRSE